jgi:hypothetical protein
MTSPVHESAAYRRGVARGRAELAKAPRPDGTVTVSAFAGPYADRKQIKLCRRCGWARPGRCTCPTRPT